MVDSISFKRVRYFVLKSNNLIEEFFTIDDALNIRDKHFVIIDKFKEYFKPLNGFDWRVSEFTFIENNNQPFNLSDNSWTVHSIDTIFKSSNQIIFDITISDPSRKIRRVTCELQESRNHEDNNAHDIILIQMTLDKLHEHSKFQSWEQIDLKTENNNLKNTVKLLEKKINDMKRKA